MAVKRFPADIAFSKALRESYDWDCQKCGLNFAHDHGMLDAAHIHSRAHRSTRWCYKFGAIPLCKSCHQYYTKFPLAWQGFCREYFGDAWVDEALQKTWQIGKYTKAEQKEIAAHYREEESRIKKLRLDGATGYIKLISYD